MRTINQSESVQVVAPTLPTGGGAMQGMGESLNNSGMNGQSSLSIPLPISTGRGYAPQSVLQYSSGAGNGSFGIGWDTPFLVIRRRTSKGVPQYQVDQPGHDEFLAPNGEVMTPEVNENNQRVTRQVAEYAGTPLDKTYSVTRYYASVTSDFELIERWQSANDDFWLVHTTDGQLHCLGKQTLARIADPSEPLQKIGQWLLEESVSPTGEHICYVYQAENSENVPTTEAEASRTQSANRYLIKIQYGNVVQYGPLYLWNNAAIPQPEWLFTLVFDYGERSLNPQVPPPYEPQQSWPCRLDSFSDYVFGFEVRTHRLCHQILMFHHFADELQQPSTLVSRLLLSYEQSRYLSQLTQAQQLGYAPEGDTTAKSVLSVPPLELVYGAFRQDFSVDHYQELPAFAGVNDGVPYQLVDLYGEGLPGILYQVAGDWRYQAPQRADNSVDAISYSPWQELPILPSLNPVSKMLTDLTGDGRLDWVIAQRDFAGYFSLNPDQRWSSFLPFPAFPTEFLQPSAQFADLVGGGLPDLALIGPKSVRVYSNLRVAGFAPGIDVPHLAGDLPVFGPNQRVLVAFSDVLGSGQQHLVSIRNDNIQCWPNLGRGKFGTPITLSSPYFDLQTFDVSRLFLADINGSGAADLIYVDANQFRIYMNCSGNGFDTDPLILPMPAGVQYDNLDQISFADINGSGTASLILSVPHMSPQHWCYDFASNNASHTKPYLLQSLINNLGSKTSLVYSNSAQQWLDEKQANPEKISHLPFSMPLLAEIHNLDEVTGNTFNQTYCYRQGVYAGADREFRGFGYVEQWDSFIDAGVASTAKVATDSPPAMTKTWYHTGEEGCDVALMPPPYQDAAMFGLGPTRLTQFDSLTGAESELDIGSIKVPTRYQLYRSLKGSVLRVELYGVDQLPQQTIPYNTEEYRYQVRLVQAAPLDSVYCVVLPMALEQLTVSYDRIASDPQVQQTVMLQADEFGYPLWQVAINYARRVKPTENPYAPAVSDTQWSASYDNAQQLLRLTETRQSLYNLVSPQVWRLALPYQQRANVITAPTGYSGYPANKIGLSYEALHQTSGVLGPDQTRLFAGQSVTYYFDSAGQRALPAGVPPPPLALIHHLEVAELDEQMLLAYDQIADLPAKLQAAGYIEQPMILALPDDVIHQVWVIPQGYSTYIDASGRWLPFYLPRSQQSTLLVGAQQLHYDQYSCVVTEVTDALSFKTTAEYDYRFLAPWQTIDINENCQQVLFDALGRVVATAYFGEQLSPTGAVVAVGFKPVAAFDARISALSSIDAALLNPPAALQQAASTILYALDSWQLKRIPIHTAVLLADQFPEDAAQQIQIVLTYSDGFARVTQTSQKTEPGGSFVLDDQGKLETVAGEPVIKDSGALVRWIVSGCVEYNNKGLPIRSYQPYFLDKSDYVKPDPMLDWGYAATYYYDPLGRETRMITALNYLQRQRYYPWFTVVEDLNDTLSEVLSHDYII